MKQLSTLIFIASLFSNHAQAETCLHQIKEGTEKITWTGFKYTKKAPVSGTFDKVTFKQDVNSESMAALLESIEFEIDTNSVNSGNPVRDSTLKKSIFGFTKEEAKISGKFKNATQLDVIADLVFNEEMETKLNLSAKEGKLVITGTLDLLKNGLQKSYDSVHLACKGLHTGDDGVSKTWTTVDLKIEADYEVKCSKGLIDSIKAWFS